MRPSYVFSRRPESLLPNIHKDTGLISSDQLTRLKPIIVIPARDEADAIGEVIAEIRAALDVPILVVDDASRDDTARIARSAGARAISLTLSLGAWGATQTGIRYAHKHGFQTVITMDADGQHISAYLGTLLSPLRHGAADVVIGACPQRASAARHFAWAFFRRLAGFELADLTSGFRAYNRAAIEALSSREATLLDYQDLGVLILLRRCGLNIIEVPVQMRPRSNGASRVFSSWWAVGAYMLHTGLLCLARWRVPTKKARA